MSYEQNEINNFRNEFDKFVQYWYNWNSSQNNNFKYLKQFNTKLRMPFAIKNIELEYSFLSEKQADMKELHKFLYKLTDLWFAYEAFFKLYEKITNTTLPNSFSKTNWLMQGNYNIYNSQIIQDAVETANRKLKQIFFNNENNKNSLKNYIQHCKNHSKGGQENRLNQIITNFEQDLTVKDILTITYAIRNNYVHNGETTITNAGLENLNFIFSVSKKLELVKICYNFLAILVVNITNTLLEQNN